jgi:hypothetical protein
MIAIRIGGNKNSLAGIPKALDDIGSDRDNALKDWKFGGKLPAKRALDTRFSPEIWPVSSELGKGRTT